jgi:hypothetical protein
MNYIYLIGNSSAARTQSETMARAFEQASGYHRCTQEAYLRRMREIRALDTPADPDICPTCGTQMDWEDCDVCGGEGYIDAYDLDPLWYDLSDVEMCNQCYGLGGWWTCSCSHIYPTEKERTASNPASGTPADIPAPPLAGCQQGRQRKEPL